LSCFLWLLSCVTRKRVTPTPAGVKSNDKKLIALRRQVQKLSPATAVAKYRKAPLREGAFDFIK
ncbi:MAG: hypothetical protein J1E05_01175, partial [Eubacterium sp.]|nr:hypothetical protein [Eubacterium sp.]